MNGQSPVLEVCLNQIVLQPDKGNMAVVTDVDERILAMTDVQLLLNCDVCALLHQV